MRGSESGVLDESVWAPSRMRCLIRAQHSLSSLQIVAQRQAEAYLARPLRANEESGCEAKAKPPAKWQGRESFNGEGKWRSDTTPLLRHSPARSERACTPSLSRSLGRSVGRLPCPIDAVWFDSEKLLGKEGRKGGREYRRKWIPPPR